jgi:hypothetical protein
MTVRATISIELLIRSGLLFLAGACCNGLVGSALAQSADTSASELAKKLSNPVAALISVPFQFNYDGRIGGRDRGERLTLNIQPVVPFALNTEWNLISRTVLPVTMQREIFPTAGRQFGLGDTVQSLFLSPARPTSNGIIWGVGPVFLLPTGTHDFLSAHQWGAGPTAVLLKQDSGWTYGVLTNHIWSFASSAQPSTKVNSTFVQPFISYTTSDFWTFGLNTESTYNWQTHKLALPINLTVSKLLKLGDQPISIGAGIRYHAVSPANGPKGWGARLVATLLFPK